MNYAANGTAIGHGPLSCLRKKRFDSEADSWSAIFRMRARNQDTERLVPYKCDYCHQWHLGRTPPRMVTEMPRLDPA